MISPIIAAPPLGYNVGISKRLLNISKTSFEKCLGTAIQKRSWVSEQAIISGAKLGIAIFTLSKFTVIPKPPPTAISDVAHEIPPAPKSLKPISILDNGTPYF